MSSSNAHVCPQCKQLNSPLATNCFMCGAAMPDSVPQANPMAKPPPVRETIEDSTNADERLRPGAYVVMGIGALLVVLGALAAIYGGLHPHEITPGSYSYSMLKNGIVMALLGAGLIRVGMGNLDWTVIGLDLQGQTQWGPVIMAPGTIGLPLGLLMWFGMREHGGWVVLVLILSVISLGVGGFFYAREVIRGNGRN